MRYRNERLILTNALEAAYLIAESGFDSQNAQFQEYLTLMAVTNSVLN